MAGPINDQLEAIRQANDIVEVIGSQVSLKRRGREFVGLCPFHNDSSPSLNVSPAKQIFKCFSCGAGGDVFNFLMRREGMTFPEAVESLAQRAGIEWRRSGVQQGEPGLDRATLAKLNQWAVDYFARQLQSESGRKAQAYLQQRGIAPQTTKQFSLGYAPPGTQLLPAARQSGFNERQMLAAGLLRPGDSGGHYDYFRDRLIFPIVEAMGRVIGFGGRVLGSDQQPKYLNSPQTTLFDKSRNLYGLFQAKHSIQQTHRVVVVEGYTDVNMAHQMGVTEVVATLGTAVGEQHVGILRRYTDRIVLFFDADMAGQRAADRALTLFLQQGVDVKVARLPEGTDPCDFLVTHGADAFRGVIEQARDALRYKWESLVGQTDTALGATQRSAAVEEFLAALAQAAPGGQSDPIRQGIIINDVASALSIPVEQVYRRLSQIRKAPRRGAAAQKPEGVKRGKLSLLERAYRDLIEVLLNKPGYYSGVAELLVPEEIQDPLLQAAASHIKDRLDGEACSSEQLLHGVENSDLASYMAVLQEEGEQKKKTFEAAWEGAVACIRGCHSQREDDHQVRSLRQSMNDLSEEELVAKLSRQTQRLRRPDPRRPGAQI